VVKVMTSRQGPWSNISSGKVQPGLGRRSLCNHKQRLPEKRQVHHMSVERRRELFTRYLARSWSERKYCRVLATAWL